MSKICVVPPALAAAADHLKMSPAIISGSHVFLTGATGGNADGSMPDDPAAQMRNAFDKMAIILDEAGVTLQAVVEMTTYHIGLRDHFDVFDAIRLEYFQTPYPAWTAVEVAGLRRVGAVIEIRAIAALQPDG